MFLKACGITRAEDAAAAYRAGFDAVGFVFAPSPRRVSPEQARSICRSCPSGLLKVGVFMDEDPPEVKRVSRFCGLDLLQFHGKEDPSCVSAFGRRAIKALSTGPAFNLEALEEYGSCFALLLDSSEPGRPGGSGIKADWKKAAEAASRCRIILAGGLTPALALRAAAVVRPFGLDVSSGVECEPGVKDHEMLKAFARAARTDNGEKEVRPDDMSRG